MNKSRIIFYITVRDLQIVARDNFGRELSEKEIEIVEKLLQTGTYIEWYTPLETAVRNAIKKEKVYDEFDEFIDDF
ncbi:MAG: hypothetical protein QG635_1507 [Bacteroidota bacterium]|nr:hypothetical protein [Bacteroidota bacterium]